MIQFFCHPTLEKLLAQNKVKMNYQHSPVGIAFISSYLPQYGNNSYIGLFQAVQFRLLNPSCHPIIIMSFHSKGELVHHDTYGILSLYGTEYLQLPVSTEVLNAIIETCNTKYGDSAFSILKIEWSSFFIPAFKDILKRRLSELHHGNQNDFVNSVTAPLRAACVASLSFTGMLPKIKEQLQKIQKFIGKDEISEFMTLASKANSPEDVFLLTISNFSEQLEQLAGYRCHTDVEIKQLIFMIDNLNETYSKMQAM